MFSFKLAFPPNFLHLATLGRKGPFANPKGPSFGLSRPSAGQKHFLWLKMTLFGTKTPSLHLNMVQLEGPLLV